VKPEFAVPLPSQLIVASDGTRYLPKAFRWARSRDLNSMGQALWSKFGRYSQESKSLTQTEMLTGTGLLTHTMGLALQVK